MGSAIITTGFTASYSYKVHSTKYLQQARRISLSACAGLMKAGPEPWDGRSKEYLIEQEYSEQDDHNHLRWLAHVFADRRYLRVNRKPLFLVYRASQLPNAIRTTDIWREEAARLGIGELFLCRVESFPDEHTNPSDLGFDASVEFQPDWTIIGAPLRRGRKWRAATTLRLSNAAYQTHRVYQYGTLVTNSLDKPRPHYLRFPCVTPKWDNSPRRKIDSVIFTGSTPELYEFWLSETIRRLTSEKVGEKLVFVNAWNEWAEGNYLEPDMIDGHAYLEATRRALENCKE